MRLAATLLASILAIPSVLAAHTTGPIAPHTIAYVLLAVAAVSIVSFVGIIALAFKHTLLKQALLYLVALAAGTLLGDVFLHLLPHHATEYGFTLSSGALVLIGVIIIFIIERFIHWHHCHEPHLCEDPHSDDVDHSDHTPNFGISILIGDGLHNFLDGALIAASFLVSPSVGLATTIAVLLHEIPQEVADFGVLLHAGYSKTKALILNFVSALTAVVGAVVVLIMSASVHYLEAYLVPVTAGMFVYIAGTDLLPELRQEGTGPHIWLQFGAFLLGIGIMAALLLIH